VLPADLARLDDVLSDPAMLAPFRARFQSWAGRAGRRSCAAGPAHHPHGIYLRLMVVNHHTGWVQRASVLAELGSAATVAAVPLLHLTDVLEFWQLVVLVLVLSSLNSRATRRATPWSPPWPDWRRGCRSSRPADRPARSSASVRSSGRS
jgi:hypothetical protein